MKAGTTYEGLLARVERDAAARQDFYAPTDELRLTTDGNASRLVTPAGEFGVRDTAHLHLAELTGIDRRYYQKLREHAPELLDRNVNHWLSRSDPKQRVIRALDSDARAIVSPRYAALDNDGLLKAVEPIIADLGATVESCDITDERLIVKLVSPCLRGDVQVNDPVQLGLVLRNSEVRAGALSVQPLIFRLVCTNGMIVGNSHGQSARRRHIGRVWGNSDPYGLVPENIERTAWEKEVWTQLQSNIRQAVNADAFQALLERLSATTKLQTTLEPQEVVERLGKEYRLGSDVQERVVGHLQADYDGSLWSVVNGVTRSAQEVGSYDMATDLETLGGQLAHLTPRDWDRMVNPN